MTYSIVARDPATGALGCAVASRFFAVGSLVPHMNGSVVVASQAFLNPMWGVEGVERLTAGEAPSDVLADFVARDGGSAIRQAHVMDAQGRIAAHTGEGCIDWAGHEIGSGASVAGNMLAGPQVVSETLRAWRENDGAEFVDRLLTAMEAGEAAGGDKRGRQAAGLRVHRGQDYAHLDLRVDDHADPLAELRRLHAVAGERYEHFAHVFATRDNFQGRTDRTELDRAIAEREARAKADGTPSRSFATTA